MSNPPPYHWASNLKYLISMGWTLLKAAERFMLTGLDVEVSLAPFLLCKKRGRGDFVQHLAGLGAK